GRAQRPLRAAAPARPATHGPHRPRHRRAARRRRGAERRRVGPGPWRADRRGDAMSPAVEIAVEDLAGLDVAALAGADRIELCQDLDLGGTTPAPELVEQAVRRARELVAARDAKPHLDVHVLIRPRASSADFLGRPAEFAADADAIERMADQAAAVV